MNFLLDVIFVAISDFASALLSLPINVLVNVISAFLSP